VNRTFEPEAADTHIASRDEIAETGRQKYLDTAAICAHFGISRHTWARWVKSGQAPAPDPALPGHPRWRVSDIERFKRGRMGRG
jgi:predicted DNA-binding transcriptional regulator AlpA